ncbi:HPr(Ser) kinase/phosphatase [Sporosarcina siberiensis]|uniref:HPr kinase/phosphorylase n=1 Tax=Sporosarcina siberiensis TaxID=1365606 RepID=A0ABW4SBW4_9BACL
MSYVLVKKIQDRFSLQLKAGEEGLGRKIYKSDISRPGLEMAGYFTFYPSERIQVLGKTELSFFNGLEKADRIDRMNRLCTEETPAIIAANGMEVPVELYEAADKMGIPVFRTSIATTRFSGMLANFLESKLAPMTAVHGVLVDVYGIGILITGKSGIGKSETALELVKRGHRLVADDLVEIRQVAENILIGTSPELIEHLLEIRGVGIIDMMTLFGASAIKGDIRISIVLELEDWVLEKTYDRLGLDEEKIKIIGTELTKLTVPVRPGRNLAVIIEVAAMDYRLKRLGVNAARDFSDKLDNVIGSKPSQMDEEE